MIRTLAIIGAAAAIACAAPSTTSSSTNYARPIPAAAAASSCTPLVLRYWNIDKRVVDGPGGPTDPETFVAAGLHYKRGCEITSGRATLSLQFHYKGKGGRYHWYTMPDASVSADLAGKAHTLFNLVLPKDREPNCTGTRGHYRIKLNLSPGTVVFEGKTYHIPPEVDYFPSDNKGQTGKWLDCRNAAS